MVLAYVLVRTKPGTSKEIVSSRLIRGVKMAHNVLGQYDAVLVVAAKSNEELSKTIYEVMERHPNVDHVETLLAVFSPQEAEKPKVEDHPHVISFNCPNCNSLIEVGSKFCHFCGWRFEAL